jgi:hypothetical protein
MHVSQSGGSAVHGWTGAGAGTCLHRDAEALVQRAQAAAPVRLGEAVGEALEVSVGALPQVGSQARPRVVQRIHYEQRSGPRKAPWVIDEKYSATHACSCLPCLIIRSEAPHGCLDRSPCPAQGPGAP